MNKNNLLSVSLLVIATFIIGVAVFYNVIDRGSGIPQPEVVLDPVPVSQQYSNTANAENKNTPAETQSAPLPAAPETNQDKPKEILDNEKMTTQLTKPEILIDANKKYFAEIDTTSGKIKVEFTANATPITVNNFVYLAKNKFYDGTIFHRTINGFMIQGGDPTGTGAGGPGYKFDDEKFTGEYKRGVMAMANSGPNTNGSQFFIMHKDQALPKNYVIFGTVVEGLEAVDAIATAPVKSNAFGEQSTPVTAVKINKVEIIEE